MKAIKVNADYETMLFENKLAPKIVNQSIEFLALYLDERPLFSDKAYSQEFLNHVRNITGRNPLIVREGAWENWWGDLKDIPLELKLNSKEFILPFSIESKLITSLEDLSLIPGKTYLAKSPFGMSGQNFLSFTDKDSEKIKTLLSKCRKLIIEPFHQRVHDFSHYVFSDGSSISYQNLVDDHFQYKGTLFRDLSSPSLEDLSFYDELYAEDWKSFKEKFKEIISLVRESGGDLGYSIDSYTYVESGELKIRAISEVNYRKTMGLMAWLLSRKYLKEMSWALFVLGKPLIRKDSFSHIQEKISSLAGCIHLSPGDTRFEAFLLGAQSDKEGKEKYEELQKLLPDCQFSINI